MWERSILVVFSDALISTCMACSHAGPAGQEDGVIVFSFSKQNTNVSTDRYGALVTFWLTLTLPVIIWDLWKKNLNMKHSCRETVSKRKKVHYLLTLDSLTLVPLKVAHAQAYSSPTQSLSRDRSSWDWELLLGRRQGGSSICPVSKVGEYMVRQTWLEGSDEAYVFIV